MSQDFGKNRFLKYSALQKNSRGLSPEMQFLEKGQICKPDSAYIEICLESSGVNKIFEQLACAVWITTRNSCTNIDITFLNQTQTHANLLNQISAENQSICAKIARVICSSQGQAFTTTDTHFLR